jgi:hypothetical protein
VQNHLKTHCLRGHEFTPENTYVAKTTGFRQCKECGRLRYGREGHVPWTPPEMPDDIATLAYAAGIVDGEGTIGIRLQNNGAGKFYHTFKVRVANTDKDIIEWLTEQFGGSWGTKAAGTNGTRNTKESYHWTLTSGRAGSFLAAIRPYMRIKAPQADLALALVATKQRSNGSTGISVTPELYDYREDLRQKMLVLNQRGIAA